MPFALIRDGLAKRAAQVEIMAEVYSCGTGNIVYLGEVDEVIAKDTVAMIRALHEDARDDTEDFATLWSACKYQDYSPHEIRAPLEQEALMRLLSWPWSS